MFDPDAHMPRLNPGMVYFLEVVESCYVRMPRTAVILCLAGGISRDAETEDAP